MRHFQFILDEMKATDVEKHQRSQFDTDILERDSFRLTRNVHERGSNDSKGRGVKCASHAPQLCTLDGVEANIVSFYIISRLNRPINLSLIASINYLA